MISDAELLELYAIYADAFVANVAIAMTLVFAYLAATYVSAKSLNAFQFYLTTTFFAVFTISVAMGAFDLGQRTVSIQSELLRRISLEDSQISYIAVDGMPSFIPPFILGVFVFAVLLSIVFAFSIRRGET